MGLIPVDDDPDTGGYFEAARRGELAVRRCDGCDRILHLPRPYCRDCGSWEGRWETVPGSGTLYSWTAVTHQVHPMQEVPYTIILVQLDAHPAVRFIGRLDGTPQLIPGQPVEAYIEYADGVALPNWRLCPAPTN
jgi:uncharacterized OB-fold protein